MLYSDEDKMSMDGHKFQPHFKPDYNPDLLCTVNYICHLFVVKRELLDQVGMLRSAYDGAQDYDFVFRCVEAVKDQEIYHIPRIPYHWRCHEDSTAENPESKGYAFEAGKGGPLKLIMNVSAFRISLRISWTLPYQVPSGQGSVDLYHHS